MLSSRKRAIRNAVAINVFIAGESAQLLKVRCTQDLAASNWLVRIREWIAHPVVHPKIQVRHYEHRRLELLSQIKGFHRHDETLIRRAWQKHDVLRIPMRKECRA